MSASAWDGLRDLMVCVAEFVDYFKVVILWTGLFAFVVWLGVWFLKVLLHFGGHGPGMTAGGSFESSLLNRLDEKAGIAISRRPRKRKRRHRHRHNADLASPRI